MQIKDTTVDTSDPSSSSRSKKGLILSVKVPVLAADILPLNAQFRRYQIVWKNPIAAEIA